MKIECVREKLAVGVRLANRMVGKNTTLPILSCVHIEAKKGAVVVRATNLDIGIEVTIPSKVSEEGFTTVPGNIISNYLDLISDRTISLETVSSNLHINSATGKTTIKAQDSSDFPNIPKEEHEVSFKVNGEDLMKGLSSVFYSAATSSIKPELSSVFLAHSGDDLIFAATDSFRLAEKKIKTKKVPDFSILIPYKNIQEIIKALEGASGEIDLHLNKNQISLYFDNIFLTSRLVEGIFPDYNQIIPKDFATEAVVLKEDLIQSLKLTHVFTDSFNQINLKCNPGAKLLEIKAKNNDVGENTTKLQAVLKGDDLEINFNYRYLTDSFQSISSDSLSLGFNGAGKALLMRGVGDRTFTYLVMPMNR